MDRHQRIKERFRCPKCKNHASVCKESSLSGVTQKILGMSNDRYLLVSCSLCGYTEIYNLKVIADARQEDLCPRAVPEPREG